MCNLKSDWVISLYVFPCFKCRVDYLLILDIGDADHLLIIYYGT
jgi:hypothetical protein